MSRFPFSIPGIKVTEVKRRDVRDQSLQQQEGRTARYKQKLSDYEDTLERYLSCIKDYEERLEELGRKPADNQLSIVQAAMDLKSIKEQGRDLLGLVEELRSENGAGAQELTGKLLAQDKKVSEHLEGLFTTLIDINYKLEGLDKDAVNRLSEVMIELQKQTLYFYKQNNMELQTNYDALTKSVKKNRRMLIMLFVFQILGLGAMTFVILYLLEIISI